jgi:hypothetical protein
VSLGNGVGMKLSHGVSEDASRVNGPLALHGPPPSTCIEKEECWAGRGIEGPRTLRVLSILSSETEARAKEGMDPWSWCP